MVYRESAQEGDIQKVAEVGTGRPKAPRALLWTNGERGRWTAIELETGDKQWTEVTKEGTSEGMYRALGALGIGKTWMTGVCGT